MKAPLSAEEFLAIEERNKSRKKLRAKVSKGRWDYDSFAWVEVESSPRNDHTCILLRRRSWFDGLSKKYGNDVLDRGVAGKSQSAIQPAHDAFYVEAALNDPIEEDIRKLLEEIRRLRADLHPPYK